MKKILITLAVFALGISAYFHTKYRTVENLLVEPNQTPSVEETVYLKSCETIADRSIEERLEIQGEKIDVRSTFFFAPGCQEEAWFTWSSVAAYYEAAGGVKADFSAGLLNVHFRQLALEPSSNEAAASATKNRWCGRDDWKVGSSFITDPMRCPDTPANVPNVINLSKFRRF